MSIKKKLGMGVLSAALGIALIGGGTFAYFSDTAEQTSTFASGIVELNTDPTTLIDLDKFKPGDHITKNFELSNDGNIDMKNISLESSYKVVYGEGHDQEGQPVPNALANKYADSIIVKFLSNTSGERTGLISGNYYGNTENEIIEEMSLLELRDLGEDQLAERLNILWFIVDVDSSYETGLAAGDTNDFVVKFEFEETGAPQNDLQNLDLELTWEFEGFQVDGEER